MCSPASLGVLLNKPRSDIDTLLSGIGLEWVKKSNIIFLVYFWYQWFCVVSLCQVIEEVEDMEDENESTVVYNERNAKILNELQMPHTFSKNLNDPSYFGLPPLN